jgi:hypothetical protein
VSEGETGQDSNRDRDDDRRRIGLCADCRFMRLVQSARGSKFYLCERSATDPAFPKYPRLPVLQCRGYESAADKGTARG